MSNVANGKDCHPDFDGRVFTPSAGERIHSFASIPGILSLKLPEIEYLVPALAIPRKSIVLWCGQDGTGKTYLAEAMAVAVARGDVFLGMRCIKRPVLYLDFENPAHTAQERFQVLLDDDIDPSNLKVWGIWADQQPPRHGNESNLLLMEIVRQAEPLVIIDTLRSFHDQKENESDGMKIVMGYLRALTEYGATVVLLHHPSKNQDSNGRGSNVIHSSVDVALMHSLDKESGLITLRIDKNRNGATRSLTVRADFENGAFEATNSPFVTTRDDDVAKLEKVIRENPGSSQNRVVELAGIMRSRAARLLKRYLGKCWTTETGANRTNLYYPYPNPNRVVLGFPEPLRTTEPLETPVGGSVVLPPIGGNHPTTENHPIENHREPLEKPNGKTLPSCPACSSFAIYREPDGSTTCMTCDKKN